jgi:hypothetical protein
MRWERKSVERGSVRENGTKRTEGTEWIDAGKRRGLS